MAQSVDVQLSVPRLKKGWSRFGCNVENDDAKSCYKRTVAVPFLYYIDIFALLLSVVSCNIYNIDETTEMLFQGYKNGK